MLVFCASARAVGVAVRERVEATVATRMSRRMLMLSMCAFLLSTKPSMCSMKTLVLKSMSCTCCSEL